MSLKHTIAGITGLLAAAAADPAMACGADDAKSEPATSSGFKIINTTSYNSSLAMCPVPEGGIYTLEFGLTARDVRLLDKNPPKAGVTLYMDGVKKAACPTISWSKADANLWDGSITADVSEGVRKQIEAARCVRLKF